MSRGRTSRERRDSARPLADLLDRVLSGLGVFLSSRTLSRLVEEWPSLVGEELAQVSEPLAVRGDAIVVRADSPVVAEMLSWKAEEILDRLRGEAGSDAPRRLSVMVRRPGRRSLQGDP